LEELVLPADEFGKALIGVGPGLPQRRPDSTDDVIALGAHDDVREFAGKGVEDRLGGDAVEKRTPDASLSGTLSIPGNGDDPAAALDVKVEVEHGRFVAI
jgi:hypothetical protein